MIRNLVPKTGDPDLNTTDASHLFFADCEDCLPFLTVSLSGTFEFSGETTLQFKVRIAEGIMLENIVIDDPIENVIHIQLNEDPISREASSTEYFVMIGNGTTLAGTTMIFTATRKNKKGAWKYTKASGPIGRPRKKGEENGSGRRGLNWFRRRRSI
jgi:hypothetical protein